MTTFKLAGLSLIVVFAAAAVVFRVAPASFSKQAQTTAETAAGISPYELQQQIDVKRLPVLEIADLI